MRTFPSSFDSPGKTLPGSADPWLGRRLGRYRIDARLGQGGMGVVYRAVDPSRRRTVALKLLAGPSMGDADQLRRLLREARSAGRLDHPNIVAVLDIEQSDGVHYVVMEWVRGGSVQDFLDLQGPFSWPIATWIAAEVCRGLVAAHAAGLVHRDVKPSNVLLGRGGAVKLADFGLAKAADQSTVTSVGAGRILGTPHFMSPEQCRAEEADDCSDIYALGATYFALLTGQPPYPLEVPVQVMFAHCSRPTPDPRATTPGVPDACARVVLRAMAKRRDQRHPSASALLAELEAVFATAGPAQGRPTFILPGAEEDRREKRDRDRTQRGKTHRRVPRVRLWLAAGLALALVVVAAAFALRRTPASLSPPDEWGVIVQAAERAIDAKDTAAAQELLGKVFAHRDTLRRGAGVPADLDTRIGDLVDRLRGVILFPAGHEAGRLLPMEGTGTGLAWSADHRWLAASSIVGGKGVWLWDSTFPEPRHKLWPQANVYSVAFSPDGETLAAGCAAGKVRLWREGKESILTVGGGTDVVSGLSWDPYGRLLAVRFDRRSSPAGATSVTVWDVQANKLAYHLAASAGKIHAVAFAPAGSKLLATCGENGAVLLWDTDKGWTRGPLATGFAATFSVAFDAHGILAITGYHRDSKGLKRGIQLWDVRTKLRIDPPLLETSLVRDVSFSADGRILASSGVSQARLWDAVTRKELALLGTASKQQHCGHAFSPGGGLLAVGEVPAGVRLFDLRRSYPRAKGAER